VVLCVFAKFPACLASPSPRDRNLAHAAADREIFGARPRPAANGHGRPRTATATATAHADDTGGREGLHDGQNTAARGHTSLRGTPKARVQHGWHRMAAIGSKGKAITLADGSPPANGSEFY
jgi:hypothetical protein